MLNIDPVLLEIFEKEPLFFFFYFFFLPPPTCLHLSHALITVVFSLRMESQI